MCLQMFLVVLFIFIGNYSSVAQQHNCQKVQIDNSKMYGECCVFVKVDNINLHEEVEEALSKFHNPNGTVKLPQYHRNNRPPPRPNNRDTEDLHSVELSLLPNIREKPNNQFDNPIIMKFQSNNRGAENQYPKENIGPENLQSGGHLNRERGVSRDTYQNNRPIETSHRDSSPVLLPVDQHDREFSAHSHKKTTIIENSMTKNNRVRQQDTPLILDKKGPQDNAKMSDNFPSRRQDERSDNYPSRSQGDPEITRLPEDFVQRRPQDDPSFESTMPIINRDDLIRQHEAPSTKPNNLRRPNSPPLQRNPQKTNVSGPNQSTIKPLIISTTEDDSSDIVFLPDEHTMDVPKVTENTNVTSNVSGVVVDNRNAVGVPNERVLPNGDQATEF